MSLRPSSSSTDTFRQLISRNGRTNPWLITVVVAVLGIGALVRVATVYRGRPLIDMRPPLNPRQFQQGGAAGMPIPLPPQRENVHHRVSENAEVVPASGEAKISMPSYKPQDIRRIVQSDSTLQGLVNKVGITPTKYWHWSRKDLLLREWWRWGNNTLDSLHRGYPTTPGVPPPGCMIYINHLYRYIYVRNVFSSSSFFEEVLGGECRGHLSDKPTCGNLLGSEQSNMDEERAKKLWQDYFVFTISGNPWKRAAAIYKFLEANPPVSPPLHMCRSHSWETFVRDPNVFGRDCEYHGCCRIPINPTFEQQLTMAESRCSTNLGHQSSVDFVLRESALPEDLPELVENLNKNANANADSIVLKEVSESQPGGYPVPRGRKPAWHWDDQWADLYTQDNSKAFTFISMFFADDLKFFQYPLPATLKDGSADDDVGTLASIPHKRARFSGGKDGRWFTAEVQSGKVKW